MTGERLVESAIAIQFVRHDDGRLCYIRFNGPFESLGVYALNGLYHTRPISLNQNKHGRFLCSESPLLRFGAHPRSRFAADVGFVRLNHTLEHSGQWLLLHCLSDSMTK